MYLCGYSSNVAPVCIAVAYLGSRKGGGQSGAMPCHPCYHVAAQWKNTGQNKPKGGSWANALPPKYAIDILYSWNVIHNYLAMYTMYVMFCF